MKRAVCLALLAAWLAVPAQAADRQADQSVKAVFAQLSQLVGAWETSTADGKSHQVRYRLSANGYALVETWTLGSTRESITIYYLDGSRLLASHFCPQGNVPRLKLVGARPGSFSFSFVDGANLKVAGPSHQHSFRIGQLPDGTLERAEYYVENGKRASPRDEAAVETFRYHRIAQ